MVKQLLSKECRSVSWFYNGTLADSRSQQIVREIVESRLRDARKVLAEILQRNYTGVGEDRCEWQALVDAWTEILNKGNSVTYQN